MAVDAAASKRPPPTPSASATAAWKHAKMLESNDNSPAPRQLELEWSEHDMYAETDEEEQWYEPPHEDWPHHDDQEPHITHHNHHHFTHGHSLPQQHTAGHFHHQQFTHFQSHQAHTAESAQGGGQGVTQSEFEGGGQRVAQSEFEGQGSQERDHHHVHTVCRCDELEAVLATLKAEHEEQRQRQADGMTRLHDQVMTDLATVLEDIKKSEQAAVVRESTIMMEIQRVNQAVMAQAAMRELAVVGETQDIRQRQQEFEAVLQRYFAELVGRVDKFEQLVEETEANKTLGQQLAIRIDNMEINIQAMSARIDKMASAWQHQEAATMKLDKTVQRLFETMDAMGGVELQQRVADAFAVLQADITQDRQRTGSFMQQLYDMMGSTNQEMQQLRADVSHFQRETWTAMATVSRQSMTVNQGSQAGATATVTMHPSAATAQRVMAVARHHHQEALDPSRTASIPPGPEANSMGVVIRPELMLKKSTARAGVQAVGLTAVPVTLPIPSSTAVAADRPTIHIRRVEAFQNNAMVAPVQAAAAGGAMPMGLSSTFLPLGIAQALIGKEPGKFGGTSEAWPTWRRRWLAYIKEVEELCPQLTGRQRLAILRHWLDSATADLLEEDLQRDPDMPYDKYWARLDLSFGADDKEALRRQLRSLRLQTRGKLTEKDWRDYASRATLLSNQIGDITAADLGRMMMENLPPHPWRRKLHEEAERRQQAGVLVMEGFPSGTSAGEVEALVMMETNLKPLRVTLDGKKFRVFTAAHDHKELIKMSFDRQQLQGGSTVTVGPEAVELTGEDVNSMMLRWLRIDARVSGSTTRPHDTNTESAMRPSQEGNRRFNRFQREVQADDEEHEEQGGDAEVAEVKGKGKSTRRLNHPMPSPSSPTPAVPPSASASPATSTATPSTPTPSPMATSSAAPPGKGTWDGGRRGSWGQGDAPWNGGKGTWGGGHQWDSGRGKGNGNWDSQAAWTTGKGNNTWEGGKGKGTGGWGGGRGRGKGWDDGKGQGTWEGGRGGKGHRAE